MTADKQSVYISVDVACSCSVLNSYLASGDAEFVLHVECSNTLFRRAYPFREVQHRISIPADSLNDAVEVNVMTRAFNGIPAYKIPGAHPDYDGISFDIRRSDILAVAAVRRSGRIPPGAQVFSAALFSRSAVTHIRPESKHGEKAVVVGRPQGALRALRCEKSGDEKTC